MQDIADIDYIPLETTENVLLGSSNYSISHVSDSNIVIVNFQTGSCCFFNKEGKVKSYFNHRGNGGKEYSSSGKVVVDENAEEIFISDYALKYRIQVYSFNGQYKRTLPLPKGMFLASPHDYNAESILCYDSNIQKPMKRKQPYVFLSKKNGKIQDSLNIVLPKRLSSLLYKYYDNNKGAYSVKLGHLEIIRNGTDYIISDISSDTIYSYSSENGLTPLLVRTPSPHDMEIPIYLIADLKLSNYFFITTAEFDYNFETKEGFPSKDLVYDYSQQKFFESILKNKDYPAQNFNLNSSGGQNAQNYIYMLIRADKLKEENEKGNVSGKLKEIATKLKDDDNPVLMVVKFRN